MNIVCPKCHGPVNAAGECVGWCAEIRNPNIWNVAIESQVKSIPAPHGVWCDKTIRAWAKSGGVVPFNADNVNPASIDLVWSGRWKKAENRNGRLAWSDVTTSDALLVLPGDLYLLDTAEYISMPDNAAGILALKSSMGRRGLEHLHAGFFDPGFSGTATLEVTAFVAPVEIVSGQRIVQLALYSMDDVPERSYKQTGHYNGQHEPQPAKL